MRWALDEARAGDAQSRPDVPVGAVVLDAAGRAVGRGHTRHEALSDPTAHAEVIAIRAAAAALQTWVLSGCTLVVTLEPCPMCAGAVVAARMPRVVYGARDPKMGAVGSVWDIPRDPRATHRCEVIGGVLEGDCAALLRDFFEHRR